MCFFANPPGVQFGFVGTSLGHPADTIKTKMQADPQFSGRGAIFVFRSTVKRDGVLSLYRGFLPPLIGGSCFCSAVFGSYSSTFAACEGTFLMDPMVSGFRPAIVFASIAAASARTVIETPFELLKTRMQLGKSWRMDSSPGAVRPISMVRYRPLAQVLELYKGLGVTFFRNVLLLSTMFSALDCSTRMAPGLAGAPMVGPFFLGSVCNTVGWFVAWPFEVLKSKVQAGQFRRRSIPQMFAAVVQADGVKGLWRGYLLGGTRSFFVNGCSMVAYQCVLDLRRKRKDQRALGDADIKR